MKLNELKNYVKAFEKKAGFDKTGSFELIAMVQEDLEAIKENHKNKKIVDHKLMDLQVLILQLANRYKTNLNLEWKEHWKNSKKYLK